MVAEMHYYPIRSVAEMTGVNPVTLRAWERRYGLLTPHRTDSGHRLYSDDDIRLIQQVTRLLNDGLSISQVVRNLRQPETGEDTEGTGEADIWTRFQERMMAAVERFDERRLEQAYQEILGLYPVDTVNTLLIRPLLEQLGNRWQEAETGIAQEHFFTAYLRKKLGARLHHANMQTQGPKLILCSPAGEHHELGMLLFAITAVSHGYNLLTLGPNMPLEELPAVVETTGATAVVLSMSVEPDGPILARELPALIERSAVPVFIGGRYAATAHDRLAGLGAIPVGRDALPALRMIREHL